MKDYYVDGERVNAATGIPVDFISCPGCGKKYRRGGYVCVNCDECKACHKDNPCEEPKFRKVDDDFLQDLLETL